MTDRQRLVRLLAQYRDALQAQADAQSGDVAKLIDDMNRRILRAITKQGPDPISDAELSDLISQLGKIRGNGNQTIATWLRKELPKAAKNGTETQLAIAKAMGAAASTIDALDALDTGTLERVARTLTPKALAERWATDWLNRWDAVEGKLRVEVLRGRALGSTWLDVANNIQDELGKLDLGGDLEVFARQFSRGVFTDMSNQESIAAAREVGMDKFINLDVGDDRECDDCIAASKAEPMTVEEWMASDWGLPGSRQCHGNDRCFLAAVPPEVEDEVAASMVGAAE